MHCCRLTRGLFGCRLTGAGTTKGYRCNCELVAVRKIFSHPTSSNTEWRGVLSLLEYVGTTTEERNGKFEVTLGSETEVLEAPRGKDIDEQVIVDLRRMLREAGLSPDDGTVDTG